MVENKNYPMESSDTALTEYNQLRASVGMAPAADDDYYEYETIANVAPMG